MRGPGQAAATFPLDMALAWVEATLPCSRRVSLGIDFVSAAWCSEHFPSVPRLPHWQNRENCVDLTRLFLRWKRCSTGRARLKDVLREPQASFPRTSITPCGQFCASAPTSQHCPMSHNAVCGHLSGSESSLCLLEGVDVSRGCRIWDPACGAELRVQSWLCSLFFGVSLRPSGLWPVPGPASPGLEQAQPPRGGRCVHGVCSIVCASVWARAHMFVGAHFTVTLTCGALSKSGVQEEPHTIPDLKAL